MSGSCPEPTEVLAHLGLPADDPRRAHERGCARCQAIAANYQQFLEPAGGIASEQLRDAERRLQAAVEREGGAPPLPAKRAPLTARPRKVRPRGRTVPVRWRWGAAAAAVAAVVVLAVVRTPSPRMGRTVLREQPGRGATPTAAAPVLSVPRTLPGQGVELRWQPVEGADGYRVVLYSVALEELTRIGTLKQPQLLLTRELVPASAASGTPVLVRVVALRQGAVLSTSRATSVLTPP